MVKSCRWRFIHSGAFTRLLCATLAILLAGCTTSIVSRRIVRAPNQQMPPPWLKNPQAVALMKTAVAQSLTVSVGPPAASLAVDVIEPGDYQLKHTVDVKISETGGHMNYHMAFQPLAKDTPRRNPVGTVVLLHGIFMTKETMLHWGLYLAAAGYRTLLVDLRGHGRSTGKWITFGHLESADLIQVLDGLQRRGLVAGRVGVLGNSYGAVVGIHWAARDPRVHALVALQPFSAIEPAIIGVARGTAEGVAKRISDDTFRQAIRQADAVAGFSWSDVDVISAVRRLKIPLLAYHGRQDDWVPFSQSEAIIAAAPEGSRLQLLDDENHLTLAVRLDPIARDVLTWLNSALLPPVSEGPPLDPALSAPAPVPST